MANHQLLQKLETAAAATAAAADADSSAAVGSEINDANGVINPSTNEADTQLDALDINSLKFTNSKSQEVYVSCNKNTIS
jgi:hypothetical protein